MFWSVYAMVYDAVWDSPLTAAIADEAARWVDDSGVVVDLGCGTGLLSGRLGGHRIGVDSSGAMLRRAMSAGRVDRAVLGDVTHSSLPDSAATGVIVGNVLHLHADPRAVLDEARRLCAPGGVVFLCWPLPGLDTVRLHALDRTHGRSRGSALRAHVLRGMIGVLGSLMPGIRPHPVALAGLGDNAGRDVVADLEVAGCQRVVVLRPSHAYR